MIRRYEDGPAPPAYILGLDLGMMTDHSALCVLERQEHPEGGERLLCRGLHRWPLGVPYLSGDPDRPGVVEDLHAMLREAPDLCGVQMATDATGVGLAVVQVLQTGGLPLAVCPIVITSGHAVSQGEDGIWHVAKKHLCGAVQVALQRGRLRVAPALPLARTLQEELSHFTAKITLAGNEVFESWRERQHDDLVLAVALATWLAGQSPNFTRTALGVGGTRQATRVNLDSDGGDFRRMGPY